MGLGGAPRSWVSAESEADVQRAVSQARNEDAALLVLGGGSNIVVADAGVRAHVLSVAMDRITFEPQGDDVLVTAGAGAPWDAFVSQTVERDLSGLEALSGIPGLVGATPIQNVGAYGQEVSQTIQRVRVLDTESGAFSWIAAADCDFGYRTSRFKTRDAGRFVVLAGEFLLKKDGAPRLAYPELLRAFEQRGLRATPRSVREVVRELRAKKSMLAGQTDENSRSCGSFFLNPIVPANVAGALTRGGIPAPTFPAEPGLMKIPAAWLIEKAGFSRGTRQGAVGLSTEHALCLVAHDGATAADIVRFARSIRDAVEAEFDVRLTPEPQFWGFGELEGGLPVLD